ncbi:MULTISPECIES: cyanophycin synthetase [unclassified Herbaspirillum]|jgi:cyanophycin synthetase|uniref:cyanophycin synthetase n=1 Tax=unclassified Herbaspirillum TaxID=2624150 RepID=UPI000E2EA959|nr:MULTISPECIES: cyanophycin synthetase [unclassified Herbaspirillum]RFB72828.1 cyanophycin synthetase [Herbaspirillum sp. 3R-3a1]TFI11365.1 cyanophycin synthetase [Herbaspirillum sp. 3R11]TFI17273.1 cyanophycin synthetase [Herbaspirillum sp. 3R-11]TFI21155.1 cyanophycin synthetase [Herbaspirillum sp. 3C11]
MKNIEFLRILPLHGPNIWTYRPALEVWIDIGELEDFPSNIIPGFNERLTSWLPSLVEHRCSYGERGGFLQRLKEGTWPGHIMEHVTLELQNLAGLPGGFGKARETSTRGVYKVVVRARHEQVTRAALYAGRDLVMAAIEDKPFDVDATIEKLRDMVDSLCLGPSTACIVDAADERRIPSIRLSEGNLVQLGHGCKQRRIWTAETDQTSAIAESISRDKDLTKTLLQSCGVAIPEGRIVDSPADAWEAAEDIGLPVVVKPSDANHGRGVFIDLNTQAEVETAYKAALEEGSSVLVERFIRGNEHRLLIVGGKLAAAARGEPIFVVGDGVSTISQLIDVVNMDPRRGDLEEHPLNPVILDREPAARLELERQGLTADSVPPNGKKVLLLRNGNVAIDVTDQVHPSVAATAALAARVVGLDIAGVDLVAEDISRPLAEQRAAIVEVNAGPGLLMHLKPSEGTPRPVGQAIVEHLFKPEDTGRIPIVGITGTHGKTTIARLVARIIDLSGKHVGLACGDGLYLGQRLVEKGNRANWGAAHRILLNRAVEAAVFENGSVSILSEGLAYDRCQVGVVTNIDPADSLPEYYIDNAEQLATKVKRTQVDVVLPDGVAVLNAEDPLVADMAGLCDGEVIFFAVDSQAPVMTEHLKQGKRGVFVRNGDVIQATGDKEVRVSTVTAIPITGGGAVGFQIENVLAAVAATWALGITADLIRAGIELFGTEQAEEQGKKRKAQSA